jgi:hypothetical protein
MFTEGKILLIKLREIRDTTQNYLLPILSSMKEKDVNKKNLIIIDQFEFKGEYNYSKNLEQRWNEFKNSINSTKIPLQDEYIPRKNNYRKLPPRKDIVDKERVNEVLSTNIVDQTNSTSYSNQDFGQQIKRKIRIKRETEKVNLLKIVNKNHNRNI